MLSDILKFSFLNELFQFSQKFGIVLSCLGFYPLYERGAYEEKPI